MTKREQLLQVYAHKNIGYVPNFFTDFNFLQPAAVNERPQGSGKDWFGVEWEYVDLVKAPMVKPGTKALTDITKWLEQVHFPDLDSIDWEAAAAKETADADRENKITYFMLINGMFERTHALMGFEDAFMAMYDEPEEYQALVDAITDYKVKLIGLIGKYYKPDVICFHDDYGANDRMLMSPDLWREFFKAPLKRVIDAAQSV